MEKNQMILIGFSIILVIGIILASFVFFNGNTEKVEKTEKETKNINYTYKKTVVNETKKETEQMVNETYNNQQKINNSSSENMSEMDETIEKYLNDAELNLPELPEEI